MKRLSCVIKGDPVSREYIEREIHKYRLVENGIKIPEEIIEYYIKQNNIYTYHRVIRSNKKEYYISYFEKIISNNDDESIIGSINFFRSHHFCGKYKMIVFNQSAGGDIFYASYGGEDYGKIYFLAMHDGEDVEPVLLANSFGEFIDALEVDPEDMDLLMALPEDKRGDLP